MICLLTKVVSTKMFQTWNQNVNGRETSSQPFYVWNKTAEPGGRTPRWPMFHTYKGCEDICLQFLFIPFYAVQGRQKFHSWHSFWIMYVKCVVTPMKCLKLEKFSGQVFSPTMKSIMPHFMLCTLWHPTKNYYAFFNSYPQIFYS